VRRDRAELAAVFAGGFAGALARAALADALPHGPAEWPWATLAVNLAGAFLLGWLVARRSRLRPLLGTGLCGALTTFSTLQLEALRMLDHGAAGLALAYAAVSIGAGLVAAGAGERLA
jgi:fluoride exporter